MIKDVVLKPVMVSHHFAKINGHRHCDSEDLMVLVCHMILQNHVIKMLCELIGGSSSG